MLGILVSSIFLSFVLRLDPRHGGVYAEAPGWVAGAFLRCQAKGVESPVSRKHIDEEAMEANNDCSTEGQPTPTGSIRSMD